MSKVLNILIFFILLFFGLSFFILKSNVAKFNIEGEDYILLLEKGDNVKKISLKLSNQKLYKNNFVSFILMRILIGNKVLNVGEYELKNGDGIFDLIYKLKNKIHYFRKITFIEGEMLFQYKKQINSSFGLMGELTESTDEGYFMPGTYNYLYGETKNAVLKRAKDDMIRFVSEEFSKIEDKEHFYLKNINEVLTLASIVEKESGIKAERSLIAGVFYNRLKNKMRLQSDPTTIYEITKGEYVLDRKLTLKDLTLAGEYNTYYINGIPPYPIASPSKDSIYAVLYPQKTESLFFVADGYGGHSFSENYDGHINNVKNYRKVLKEKNENR